MTDLSINGRELTHLATTYTNLTNALVVLDAEMELFTAQLICTYWSNLMILRFHSHESTTEEVVLLLIRQLPTLYELDLTGQRWDELIPNTYARNKIKPIKQSQLLVLRMSCEHASTLQEILLLCPQLTNLTLEHPQQRYNPFGRRVSVQSALHLLCGTAVRELHLLDYGLANEDIAGLQNTLLHTLCITGAWEKLTDNGILDLIFTLGFLHTLEICFCHGVTYKIVVPILSRCRTLRSFTFRTVTESKLSSSYLLLGDVLPKLYPHVKHICVSC